MKKIFIFLAVMLAAFLGTAQNDTTIVRVVPEQAIEAGCNIECVNDTTLEAGFYDLYAVPDSTGAYQFDRWEVKVYQRDSVNPIGFYNDLVLSDPALIADDGIPFLHMLTLDATDSLYQALGYEIDSIIIECYFTATDGINQYNWHPEIQVWPNPTTGSLHITGDIRQVNVFDINGHRISTHNTKDVSLTGKAPGLYLIQVVAPDGRTAVRKIVLE
jgi:hypothetical protein